MDIDLVELYLLLSRACHRTALEVFTFSLDKLCVKLFATSYLNYA